MELQQVSRIYFSTMFCPYRFESVQVKLKETDHGSELIACSLENLTCKDLAVRRDYAYCPSCLIAKKLLEEEDTDAGWIK